MEPQNLQLPDFVLVDFYKNCLVEIDVAEPLETAAATLMVAPATSKQPAAVKHLGECRKHVVIVVNEPKAAIIKDSELEFISKILAACNLNIADTAIVNIHDQRVDYTQLNEQFNTAFLLLFGVDPAAIQLPFTVPHFQVQPYAGSTIVCTPPLQEMLVEGPESRTLKSKLWMSLKTAFNL